MLKLPYGPLSTVTATRARIHDEASARVSSDAHARVLNDLSALLCARSCLNSSFTIPVFIGPPPEKHETNTVVINGYLSPMYLATSAIPR